MTFLKTEIDDWIKNNLFHTVPMAIAIIDRDYEIVHANAAFERMFGLWRNRKCFAAYKNRESACPACKVREAFQDGVSRVSEEIGVNKNGRLTRYIQHTLPIKNADQEILFLVEISTDVTEIEQIRQENQLLFDQVPCNILLIDRDFRIVRINRRLRSVFGEIEGKFCFETLKGRDSKCTECTAHQTFTDGRVHTGEHVWKMEDGRPAHHLVTTAPLSRTNGEPDLVMEMTVDITDRLRLEDEIKIAHSFLETMIDASMDGIIALDPHGEVTIFNPSARELFAIPAAQIRVSREMLETMLPEGLMRQVEAGPAPVVLPDTTILTIGGDRVPARLIGFQIASEKRNMGAAFYIQDLREMKKLEREKMETERLAAVGQTVAGLAHGIKNIVTGLEGGIYLLNTGIQKNRVDRVSKGMDMLARNVERVALFVKEFLSFSKGREIHVKLENPARVAREVVELYSQAAALDGIRLTHGAPDEIASAPMDFNGMHECLTNLVGNAIDACRMSDSPGDCFVTVRTLEENDSIVYEVADNGCGMDYDVKQKVFTNFFTTKGLGGTGLGLLTTKKIVQEHGGEITFESEAGQGSSFRIRLPRKRLQLIMEKPGASSS